MYDPKGVSSIPLAMPLAGGGGTAVIVSGHGVALVAALVVFLAVFTLLTAGMAAFRLIPLREE